MGTGRTWVLGGWRTPVHYGKFGNKQVTWAGLTWAGFLPWRRSCVPTAVIPSLNLRYSERFKAEKLRFTIPRRAGKYGKHFAEKQRSKGSVLRRWNLNPDPRVPLPALTTRIRALHTSGHGSMGLSNYVWILWLLSLNVLSQLWLLISTCSKKVQVPTCNGASLLGVMTVRIVEPKFQAGCLLSLLPWSRDHLEAGFYLTFTFFMFLYPAAPGSGHSAGFQ